MAKIRYIHENFINPNICDLFINHSKANKKEMPYGSEERGGDTYLTTVEWKDHTAVYHGGEVGATDIKATNDEIFAGVIKSVNSLCKTFDKKSNLDYVGVVRWPPGTFMKPHVDDNNIHNPDVFAAMLYLNDDFKGGNTIFEDFEVKPEVGKLIIFSNSQYLHYVSKVEGSERFVLSFWYNTEP